MPIQIGCHHLLDGQQLAPLDDRPATAGQVLHHQPFILPLALLGAMGTEVVIVAVESHHGLAAGAM